MHHQKIEAEYSWLQPRDKGSMFIDKTKNRGDFKLRQELLVTRNRVFESVPNLWGTK